MAAKLVDSDHQFMVAGDPQWSKAAQRMQEGNPGRSGFAELDASDCADACRNWSHSRRRTGGRHTQRH
jgi:hypothetical protein